MQFTRKALYNLIRSNWLKDNKLSVKPWQVENYRVLSTDELFARLRNLHIALNEDSFLLYAEKCETPEDLIDTLWTKDEDIEPQDQAYLLLFELWRRLLPDKRSLSIFCDDLDTLIDLYHESPIQADEQIQKILFELEELLDDNAEFTGEPKAIFNSIEEACAHDLETFIYDYIVIQIESDDELYASELLDGFYAYVSDPRWFDFLRARLFSAASPEEGKLMLIGLLEQLEEDPSFDLLYEISSYLVKTGDDELFSQAIRQASQQIKNEEDFQDLSEVVRDYYHFLDRDEKAEEVHKFLQKPRQELSLDIQMLLGYLNRDKV